MPLSVVYRVEQWPGQAFNQIQYIQNTLLLLTLQDGSVQLGIPVPKFLSEVSTSGSQGGAVAPMTGTIEKVMSLQ